MVDKSVGGLITTLAIDIFIFTLLIIAFLITRTAKSAPLQEEYPEYSIKRAYIVSKEPILTQAKQVVSIMNSEIHEHVGSSPVIYLEFVRNILRGIIVIGVLGLGILVPLYSLGTVEVSTDLDKVGISHAITNANILAASIVMIFINSVIVYFIAYRYAKRSLVQEINVRIIQPNNLSEYSLWITGLPKHRSAYSMQESFRNIITQQFSTEQIVFTYVVPNYTRAYKAQQEIEYYEGMLDHWKRYEEA